MSEATPTNRAMANATARQEAIATLIERHQEEYDELHGDAREREGLPRYPASAELRILRRLLAKATEEPD